MASDRKDAQGGYCWCSERIGRTCGKATLLFDKARSIYSLVNGLEQLKKHS
jgi:hypothetical protein